MSEGNAQLSLGVRSDGAPKVVQTHPRSQSTADRATRAAQTNRAPTRQYGEILFMLAVAAVLYMGWRSHGERHLTAESGLGYQLGIVGAAMMLLLLLYPLRKRLRFMRWIGASKHWFRIHMILGILGPATVIFHANFRLGSLNSRIALISMLLVAGSGLIGRYIYLKIHYSLYGRRMNLVELREVAEENSSSLGTLLSSDPELQDRLRAYEQSALKAPRTVLQSAARMLLAGIRTRLARGAARRILRRALKRQAVQAGWTRSERRRHAREARQYLSAYFAAARKVVGLVFYERLFALWHVLHVPLFIILVITAVMHVIAVHMY